ncbi:MAG: hypothetical protein WDA17_05160 [Sphaerochaetaceae bacterium]
MTRLQRIITTDVAAVWLIISLIGCSLAWEPFANPQLSQQEMIPVVARVIDEQRAVVEPILNEYDELEQGVRTLGSFDGQHVVQQLLEQEKGEEYLRFSHAVATGASSDEVLLLAKSLVDEQQYDQLSARVLSTDRQMRSMGQLYVRQLPPSQRDAFLRDLQKLVTKTLVLMVAGIVYSCIPTILFWGKITAAAAISVAAGITATTVMSIYRYYSSTDASLSQSFEQWMVDVTTDPSAAYAIAASMTAVGSAMSGGPVVTGLIVVVFSIYQVIDLVKPLLKKYNFNA